MRGIVRAIIAEAAFIVLSSALPLYAADIHVDVAVNRDDNSQRVWVSIDGSEHGRLEDNDGDLFKKLVGGLIEDDPLHLDPVIVKLNLPQGGSLKAALEIAKYVMEMGLTTLVPTGLPANPLAPLFLWRAPRRRLVTRVPMSMLDISKSAGNWASTRRTPI